VRRYRPTLGRPRASILAKGGEADAAAAPYRSTKYSLLVGHPVLHLAMPPPSAAMRSIDRSEIVSAWSKNHFRPFRGIRSRAYALVYVERAADRLVVRLRAGATASDSRQRMRTTSSSSRSISAGMSGRGWRKSSKSAAEKDEHLAGAVVAEVVAALLIRRGFHPVEEVLLLVLRLLGEEVVGEADGELPLLLELLDERRSRPGLVLEAPTGVDGAGHAEPIQLTHEVARRIELVLERQLRPFGQRRRRDSALGLASNSPTGMPRASRTI